MARATFIALGILFVGCQLDPLTSTDRVSAAAFDYGPGIAIDPAVDEDGLYDGHGAVFEPGLAEVPGSGPIDVEDFFGFDVWDLNVVVIEDLGSAADPYGSDFQGAAAVGGDTWLANFSLNDLGGPTDTSLYAGGDVSIVGSVSNGGIDAAGTVELPGASVDGFVVGGGDLDGHGTITGDVTLAGLDLAGYSLTIGGSLLENEPYTPSLELYTLGVYFETVANVASHKAVTTTWSDAWGEIQLEVVSGMNVVEIDAATLNDAWGIQVEGPADASLYINVPDATAAMDSLVWEYSGGITSERVLLNYHDATSLDLSGGDHAVNILAPYATVTFPSGLVSGNLIAYSLQGGGQVNLGGFCCNPWDDKH